MYNHVEIKVLKSAPLCTVSPLFLLSSYILVVLRGCLTFKLLQTLPLAFFPFTAHGAASDSSVLDKLKLTERCSCFVRVQTLAALQA